MITVRNLSKSFGRQILFYDANLQLNSGNCYGIVGANGSGKSTLLRILSGEELADEGDVLLPRKCQLGILKQDHFEYENVPIIDVVMMGKEELWSAMETKAAMLEDESEPFDDVKYMQLEELILQQDGYAFESKAAEVLAGLNIETKLHHEPLSVLSGGYKLRVLLGQTLASEPDILFLDEPTNHLDILSIAWLEKFIQAYKGLTIVVSHDHRFLNTVCTTIVDIDYLAVTPYRGNYDRFVIQKAEERERREKEIGKRQKEIDNHKAFISRFKAKATKARQANSRVKRLAKIEIEALPSSSRRHPKFKLIPKRHSGKEVLRVESILKEYGEKLVLDDVSFRIQRGERVAIIGPNGIGKSTLLKIAMDEVEPDLGEVEWGYETHVGYLPQDHREHLGDLKQTIKTSLWDDCPTQPVGYVLGRLAEVLFSREEVEKKLENLSGGEAARLMMMKLAVKQPNVLVLDEPTNHLDLEGIVALANDLSTYTGTIIFVSHDRWFVNQLASRIIAIGPDGVEDYRGNYAEFLARGETDHLDKEQVLTKQKEKKKSQKRKKKTRANR